MKIADIFAEWDKDSKIDPTQLELESLKISELHNKYYKIYINEKITLRKSKETFKQLQQEKREFYTLGPNEETKAKGWELPAKGRLLKNEVDQYLSTDKELVDLSLKLGTQDEKIELLKSILETISRRSFQIRAAIDFMKMQNGLV